MRASRPRALPLPFLEISNLPLQHERRRRRNTAAVQVLDLSDASCVCPLRNRAQAEGCGLHGPSKGAVQMLEMREDYGRGGQAAPGPDRRDQPTAFVCARRRFHFEFEAAAARRWVEAARKW